MIPEKVKFRIKSIKRNKEILSKGKATIHNQYCTETLDYKEYILFCPGWYSKMIRALACTLKDHGFGESVGSRALT